MVPAIISLIYQIPEQANQVGHERISKKVPDSQSIIYICMTLNLVPHQT